MSRSDDTHSCFDVAAVSHRDHDEDAEPRIRGHGQILGKFRLDRGPLRWWLLVIGTLLIQAEPWRFALGMAMVIAGASLHVISKGYLRPGKKFLQSTKALTTRGPYRFTRNPFYLANLLAELGLLIIIGQLWIAVIYLPIWAWVYCKTILGEERKLLVLCGDVYRQYHGCVPRLIPQPWKYLRKGELSGPHFSWSNPHIAEGYEIKRALRLVSYPCLLWIVAAVRDRSSWAAIVTDPSVLVFASALLVLNSFGWLAAPILRRWHCSRSSERRASGESRRRPSPNRRWAALFLAAVSLGCVWSASQY